MSKQLLAIIFLFVSGEVIGQHNFLKRLSVAQSFDDESLKEEAAMFSISDAKESPAVFIMDLGLQYSLNAANDRMYNGIVAEYHRNTTTDAAINNLQFGYQHTWIMKEPGVPDDIVEQLRKGTLANNYSTLILNSALKYRYDHIEKAQGLAGSFLFNYFRQGPAYKFKYSAWNVNSDTSWTYRIDPVFGVEMQENFAADSSRFEGFAGRLVAKIAFSFGQVFPDPDPSPSYRFLPLKRWLFNITAEGRYDAVGKNYTDNNFHPLINSNLDFYLNFLQPLNTIIGFSFTYGDNPIQGFREFGFEPQQYWLIALKIQK